MGEDRIGGPELVVARLFRGKFDGEVLTIPEPTEILVIPRFGALTIVYYYFLAGKWEEAFAYLYEGDFETV